MSKLAVATIGVLMFAVSSAVAQQVSPTGLQTLSPPNAIKPTGP